MGLEKWVELHTWLEEKFNVTLDTSSTSGYCNSSVAGKDWFDWEREVATPALLKAGCTLKGRWFTGDGDSFGPLTRCITVIHGGEEVNLIYG